jgi:hypothetical protein
MISMINGTLLQARINYSNRFSFIQIYELMSECGHEFPFKREIAEELESLTNPRQIDQVILKHYKGKRGKRC